jgi:hypothetical protein
MKIVSSLKAPGTHPTKIFLQVPKEKMMLFQIRECQIYSRDLLAGYPNQKIF